MFVRYHSLIIKCDFFNSLRYMTTCNKVYRCTCFFCCSLWPIKSGFLMVSAWTLWLVHWICGTNNVIPCCWLFMWYCDKVSFSLNVETTKFVCRSHWLFDIFPTNNWLPKKYLDIIVLNIGPREGRHTYMLKSALFVAERQFWGTFIVFLLYF